MEKRVFFDRLKDEKAGVVIEEALNYYTGLFTEVINGHECIDNSFIVASLKIVLNEIEKQQHLAEKALVKHIMERIEAFTIDLNEV